MPIVALSLISVSYYVISFLLIASHSHCSSPQALGFFTPFPASRHRGMRLSAHAAIGYLLCCDTFSVPPHGCCFFLGKMVGFLYQFSIRNCCFVMVFLLLMLKIACLTCSRSLRTKTCIVGTSNTEPKSLTHLARQHMAWRLCQHLPDTTAEHNRNCISTLGLLGPKCLYKPSFTGNFTARWSWVKHGGTAQEL